MDAKSGNILVFEGPVARQELETFAKQRFGDMVKGVIDIESGVLALGGELHADEESVLLCSGSKQDDLWGINIYLDGAFPNNIEFDSIINIRPSQNNRSRFVEDANIREKILKWLEKKLP
jgi:hypothetical protein